VVSLFELIKMRYFGWKGAGEAVCYGIQDVGVVLGEPAASAGFTLCGARGNLRRGAPSSPFTSHSEANT